MRCGSRHVGSVTERRSCRSSAGAPGDVLLAIEVDLPRPDFGVAMRAVAVGSLDALPRCFAISANIFGVGRWVQNILLHHVLLLQDGLFRVWMLFILPMAALRARVAFVGRVVLGGLLDFCARAMVIDEVDELD